MFAIDGYLCLKNSKQIDPSFAALSCFDRHRGDVRLSNETNQLIEWVHSENQLLKFSQNCLK